MIVRRCLRPLKEKGIDTLILGCTHYPIIKDVIKDKAGRRMRIIDPSAALAARIEEYLRERGLLNPEGGGDEFYFSDISPGTEEVIRLFLGRPIRARLASPGPSRAP